MSAVILAARRPASMAAAGTVLADWAEAERGRFALWLPVLMVVGAASYLALRTEPPFWLGTATLVLVVIGGLVARHRAVARAACAAVAAAALGFAAAQLAAATAPAPFDPPRRAAVITGMVAAVETLPQGRRVTLAGITLSDGAASTRRVRVRLRDTDPTAFEAGDRIRLRALLSRPSPPAYPGAWDLQRDAFFDGLGAYGFALGPAELLARAAPHDWARRTQSLREAIAARVQAVLPDANGAVCATMLTGGTAAIPAEDRAAFRDSGLAHLLAIAGLHVGIVMALVFGATRMAVAASSHAALHWPGKALAALAALAAGGAYLMLTGAHVPIIRSFAMACLFTLGLVTGRRALSLRALALAMAALVLIAPHRVMGVSFQMSFSAVLALIQGWAALRPVLPRHGGAPPALRWLVRHVVALAITSALAGTASAPFAAYHFGQVQLYNVVANVLAVPITGVVVMPAGLVALALMPLHLEAVALVPMGWGADAILWIGRTVADWPAATFAVPRAPAWGLATVALAMAWIGLWRTRVRWAGVPLLFAGLISPALPTPPDILVSADGRLMAVRRPGPLLVQAARGGEDFTLEAWRQMWAARSAEPMPSHASGPLACVPGVCAFRPRAGVATAFLLRGDIPANGCDADVLVSLEPIRGLSCGGDQPWVDRFALWRNGAHAIWLEPGGVRILTDRDVRGDRPWVALPPPE